MSATSLQYGRGHGEDRFYDAAKARRSHRPLQRSRSAAAAASGAAKNSRVPENRAEVPTKPTAVPRSLIPPPMAVSNLQRFLESVAPSIPAQYLSKTRERGWTTNYVEYMPYFTLGDLWESFKEWSAYGAGVPLVLNGKDSVVQYYVPYLSAMQLYGKLRRPSSSSRRLGEDSDADCSRDSSSDGSSDSEHERALKYSRDQSRNHVTDTSMLWMDRLSLREKHVSLQEGFLSDDSEPGDSLDCLLFEYLERTLPYSREPLSDKVLDLARDFPGLSTSRSCDLSPSSWISVAWYPIYRIPTGLTMKDLDACFLTFHSLSTPRTDAVTTSGPTISYSCGVDGVPRISLPVFGLASYKLKGSTWISSSGCERQLTNSLLEDAGNLLRHLKVTHPDYQFFASHGQGTYGR